MGWRDLHKSVKERGFALMGNRVAASPAQDLKRATRQENVQLRDEVLDSTSVPQNLTTRPALDPHTARSNKGPDAVTRGAPATSSPDLSVAPRTKTPETIYSPELQLHSMSTSQRLWHTAYDSLEQEGDTVQLVRSYIQTLNHVLGNREATRAYSSTELNDPNKRQDLMKELVLAGRAKIATQSKITRGVGDVAQFILSAKAMVDAAVQNIPQAALPWAGVCLGLQILLNPANASNSNLSGVTYVISRMDWYCALTEHILEEDNIESQGRTYNAILQQLENKVVILYKALLLYQMRSVCSYYRHQGYVFLRALANWDDWDADLKNVKDAEETLRRDANQYIKQHGRAALSHLVDNAERMQSLLGDIREDIRGLIAFQTKARSDDSGMKCLQALFIVNPQDHMARIEDEKDKLLYGVYEWIFRTEEYAAFTSWDHSDHPYQAPCRLLWVNSPAGTGKTMLTMGIIRELSRQPAALAPSVSYFFCQGTGVKQLNSATAVLRSLLWMLFVQQPVLLSHLQDDYRYSGAFADGTEFYTLKRIFQDMLRNPNMRETYLIIDALDELDETKPGLNELVQLISTSLILSKKVKWLLSSRPEVDLLARVRQQKITPDASRTILELNSESLIIPVHAYIEYKLSALRGRRGYDDGILASVSKTVRLRASNNLLWIFLVFRDLEDVSGKYAVQTVMHYPSGLPELYRHKMARLESAESEQLQSCRDILTITSLALRPLSLSELEVLFSWTSNTDPYMIVRKCRAFLKVTGEAVSLVHQSAKDFLTENWLQANQMAQCHADIGKRCIEALSSTLKQNMYSLDYGPRPIGMEPPQAGPLAPLRYACIFWADHLSFNNGTSPECRKELSDGGAVLLFLEKCFLFWLESLSLLEKLSEGELSVRKLLPITQTSVGSPRLAGFLEDADRFIRSHSFIIQRAPMQTYGSALVFSPTTSQVRNSQWKHRLPFVQKLAGIRDNWGAQRQVLEGHTDDIRAVAFSPDGETLASASHDTTVRLWGATTGTNQQKLEGHDGWVMAVAFSPDGRMLASASGDKTVRLWDAATGKYQQTLAGHEGVVYAVAFSPDGKTLASASDDETIRLWDTSTGMHCQTLEGHGDAIHAVAFSLDSKTLISASEDKTVRLWSSATGVQLRMLEGHGEPLYDFSAMDWAASTGRLERHGGAVFDVASSPDGKTLASVSDDKTIRLWDATRGTLQRTLHGHDGWVKSVAFSPNCKTLASASRDKTVRLWDATTGTHQHTLEGHRDAVHAVAYSPDGKMLASASGDKTIRLWDTAIGAHQHALGAHGGKVTAVALSPDGETLASASSDETVRLWDTATGTYRQTLEGHDNWVLAVVYSPDGKTLASACRDGDVRLWNVATGTHHQTLKGHGGAIRAMIFSLDSTVLVSASNDRTVRLWDAGKGTLRQALEGHGGPVTDVIISPDGTMLASASNDGTVRLWDATLGTHLTTLQGHDDLVRAVAFCPDGKTLASASIDGTIRLWGVTGAHRQTLQGHDGGVYAVAFSPDGKTVASASDDGTIRLWDAATGTHWQTLSDHGRRVRSVAFSPDGRFLETNFGSLRIPSAAAPFEQCRDESTSDHALYVDEEWITLNARKLLWLPRDYRAATIAVYGDRIVIGHESGEVTFLKIDLAQ